MPSEPIRTTEEAVLTALATYRFLTPEQMVRVGVTTSPSHLYATLRALALRKPPLVALVLPEATTRTMNLFLAAFSRSLPEDVHAVLVLDRAGWHRPGGALRVPANVTLVYLPSYSPELNPIERVWLYLRERFLSLRVFADYQAIVEACCAAWNRLVAEPGRLRSLCNQPWIKKVIS